ncbi:hypothetical protein [Commensalibacter papalotli (ex Botero et al. 2024)]|uniref:EpsG family protein n=1 Tax=Commensalibacter papalotli (ex Botero et al. 2024) TaxID=2972766 RepID=A0ABN8W7M6_9PROT|nr:hypothetical protein [Commensalibacter papalotli (ex Botero et al. 2024)]CAI3931119.1 unnamed protein product [Commensalibacter papalotli (ex Botero et al. 2024)]CAI3947561.1 unnamed protein product [Commensalibacter papalotli (ex Botero et al. 2024)]
MNTKFKSISNIIYLFIIFWVIASASFSGSISKWGLGENDDRFTPDAIFNNTAHKPFIYRQLVPQIAVHIENVIPATLQQVILKRFNPADYYVASQKMNQTLHKFAYLLMYIVSFFCIFFSLYILRLTLINLGCNNIIAIFAPTIMALFFPYFQTNGGHYYDYPEILFMAAAFLCTIKEKYSLLVVITILATLNKETYFFFIIVLFPIMKHKLTMKKALFGISGLVILSGIFNVILKYMYLSSPGGVFEFHLYDNWDLLTHFTIYRQHDLTYGIPNLSRGSELVLSMIFFVMLFISTWQTIPNFIKNHIRLALIINIPLYFLFCYAGEVRDLSLLYVGIVIMVAYLLEQYIPQQSNVRGDE